MPNSKLLFILVINIALLAIGLLLFTDHNVVLKKPVPAQQESTVSSVSPTDKTAVGTLLPPQVTPVAPVPLVIERPASVQQIKQLRQEKQTNAKKLASLQTQLALSERRNKQLSAQIDKLKSVSQTQIARLQQRNRDLQQEKLQPAQQLFSEVDLLKANIQRQPDLVQLKSSAEIADKIELAGDHTANIEAPDNFSGSVEFGFRYEQDNKETYMLNGRLVLDYEQKDLYKLNSNLKIDTEKEDGEMSTEKYRWQVQGDYYLDPRNLVFARTDIQRSQFASYNKEDIYTVGYGRIVFDHSKHKFSVEIGPGYRMAEPNVGEDAVSIDEFIVRTRLNYERVISESLQVTMNTVWELGNENSIYSLNFKAQNRIYRELYLIYDFEYKYTQNVPLDTLNKEVLTGLNLMYAF